MKNLHPSRREIALHQYFGAMMIGASLVFAAAIGLTCNGCGHGAGVCPRAVSSGGATSGPRCPMP